MEFKENLLEKSIKYMKSVVAFVNGTGGKIIFGIANKTREIVGFDKEDAFKKMDAIANAVSDSCEPAIIPDSTLQTVDGKTVIVVEIFEGRQQLRSWGILFERDGKDYPSNAFASVPSMALILLVKVRSRVFTAKCSEPQVGTSNGMDEGSGVTKFLSLRTET